MKLKRIAVALAVTALGATLAGGWRRRAAARRDAGAVPDSDADADKPPCDDDVSAFIETLARAPVARERQRAAAALAGGAVAQVHGTPARQAPPARPGGAPDVSGER